MSTTVPLPDSFRAFPTQPAVTRSPALPPGTGRLLAVTLVNTGTGWHNDSAYEVDFVFVEVSHELTEAIAKSVACTRAIASDPKYKKWRLGTVHDAKSGLVLKSYNYDELFGDH